MPTITSGNSASSAATLDSPDWWLKDPTDPTRNVLLYVEDVDVEGVEQQGQFDPLSRGKTITVRGNLLGDRIKVTLMTFSPGQFAALELLRSGQRTLWLQDQEGDWWYVTWGPSRGWKYATKGSRRFRRISATFVEAEKP